MVSQILSNMLTRARARNQILQPPDAHLHPIAIALLQHGQQIEHLLELRIAHVLLANQQAHRRPPGQSPVFADKLQLRLDVVDQQRHIAVQIKVGHLKDERIAEHRHAAHAVHLGGAQRADGTRWPAGEPNLLVDAQLLKDLDQLRGRPDLDGFDLATDIIKSLFFWTNPRNSKHTSCGVCVWMP